MHSRSRGIYQKQCFPCPAVCVTSQTGLQWPPLDSPTWEDPGTKAVVWVEALRVWTPSSVDRQQLLHVVQTVTGRLPLNCPGLGVGVREATAGGSGTSVLPAQSLLPAGIGRQRHLGLLSPQPGLFGQFADDPDEGAVFIFQPLVVGFQFR